MAAMVTVPMKKMQALPQDMATTCWYTCFVMMFQWAERNPDEIKPKLVAAGLDWENASKKGLPTNMYAAAASALGMQAYGTKTPWTAANFGEWVARSPVWCAGKWHPDYAHNVIVIGASDREVRFIDPWWEGVKEATVSERFVKDFVWGDKGEANGTNHYLDWVGAIMAW